MADASNPPLEAAARKEHWDKRYQTNEATQLSWFEARPQLSLSFITRGIAGDGSGQRVIDVGGGESYLADSLLESYSGLSVDVLDISNAALGTVEARLPAEFKPRVELFCTNILTAGTILGSGRYDVWHDRAAFHFLTDANDQEAYANLAAAAVRHGGILVVGTFDEDKGPVKCSGLDVKRWSAGSLGEVFSPSFRAVESVKHDHVTPGGIKQKFVFVAFVRE